MHYFVTFLLFAFPLCFPFAYLLFLFSLFFFPLSCTILNSWCLFVLTFFSIAFSSDDGVRLYINGVQLVNAWLDRSVAESSGSTNLAQGKNYTIIYEVWKRKRIWKKEQRGKPQKKSEGEKRSRLIQHMSLHIPLNQYTSSPLFFLLEGKLSGGEERGEEKI